MCFYMTGSIIHLFVVASPQKHVLCILCDIMIVALRWQDNFNFIVIFWIYELESFIIMKGNIILANPFRNQEGFGRHIVWSNSSSLNRLLANVGKKIYELPELRTEVSTHQTDTRKVLIRCITSSQAFWMLNY